MPSSRISSRIADLLSDARDARDAGDDETARLFREMREQNRRFAVRCRKELLRLISAGQ